ncbi:prepilin-type N-terminal cleavage/methylation domain-containing protein [Maricaulis sp.]|uniref:prepilin-type N-terminal cleavage/methylation domain-containing protein n=1 Tax=Maricaulis sp. TaxID=1486257 RepID=UPI001B151451|nr:prepilin-type N-terminal cleavage/methylation domain-containing protein [Maricaulis sp.]MBO6797772.1 prepilin-type N-terminal cleavage/methylation domain-containing protein [Maricaulis sp.]
MQRKQDTGFTLVEALISVGLLALLLVMLAPTLRQISVVDQRLRDEISRREDQAALEALLRQAFINIHPLPTAHDSSGLQGSADQLSVFTRIPETGRVEQLDVAVERERLILRLAPAFGGERENQVITVVQVGRGARFYYFGEVEPGGQLIWSEEWYHNHLPRLVVLDLAPQGEEIRRIEIAVPSRAGFDCRFDSGNGACLGGGT